MAQRNHRNAASRPSIYQTVIGVYELHSPKPSLEELFLQLVEHPEVAYA